MTATYDGILEVDVKTKTISACCRAMDEAAMRGQFYISQKGSLMLRRSDKANAGQTCVCCPFCGAKVGGRQTVRSMPDVDSPQYALWCEKAERGDGPLAVPEGVPV